jgi:hypothetical protein
VTAVAALAVLSAHAGYAGEARPAKARPVEIHWVVQPADTASNGGRELRMRIPRDYVQNIHRDPHGQSGKTQQVRNNGISAVSVEAVLPNLSPRLPEYEPPQATPEERRQFFERRLIIDVKASFRPARPSREIYVSQARRGMAYRLPDLHGLERYRRMGCSAGSAFDAAKSDIPRTEPPAGCRPAADDEYMVGQDGGLAVLLSCPGPGSLCTMQTWLQDFWLVEVGFPYSKLDTWKSVRKQALDLLTSFVAG